MRASLLPTPVSYVLSTQFDIGGKTLLAWYTCASAHFVGNLSRPTCVQPVKDTAGHYSQHQYLFFPTPHLTSIGFLTRCIKWVCGRVVKPARTGVDSYQKPYGGGGGGRGRPHPYLTGKQETGAHGLRFGQWSGGRRRVWGEISRVGYGPSSI